MTFEDAQALVREEYIAAKRWPDMHSAHEGFAVLNEEVDELWDEVKINQKARVLSDLTREAVQVAAMAFRFLTDVCNEPACRR